ncbi:N-acetylmuramic acid 6-phosphate etherase [Alkalimonas collagenimarina]|uniref:N-acetylmuramic acid 6-phosphate etherase n=1 Tax=Alkalimonas collagenimarina TaxID=400390 RepID=A0ABT9GZ29_9GAMM|nr:N-acetylmuramic acid 6-phosphate etherase [Alkalimonas collagenimarina]MDP4536124.1 N-acetylmuramic acid 6-phosphate etherase [Alkalimonas collagenimarina]
MNQKPELAEAQEQQLLEELNVFLSESRNPDTLDLDTLSTLHLLERINQADQQVPLVIKQILADVAKAVDAIVAAFSKGGRLIYIGAGTSGRLGVLDAAECPPTFSTPPEQVQALIAGGESAILRAVEGAEDSKEQGVADLQAIELSAKDVVVGIAASGRTPYVVGALDYANQVGAITVAISCNPDTAVLNTAAIAICAAVGPEVLTGSTRMKSGTAQKLILNMLSTASMIKSGKVYQNLMVDVHASNQKLWVRAARIVTQATGCSHEVAKAMLADSDYNAKLAILRILTGKDRQAAGQLLQEKQGFLREAIATTDSSD